MHDLHRPLHALRIPIPSILACWKESPPFLVQSQIQKMPSLFARKHLVQQLGHSDHRPIQCCGIYVSMQRYAGLG